MCLCLKDYWLIYHYLTYRTPKYQYQYTSSISRAMVKSLTWLNQDLTVLESQLRADEIRLSQAAGIAHITSKTNKSTAAKTAKELLAASCGSAARIYRLRWIRDELNTLDACVHSVCCSALLVIISVQVQPLWEIWIHEHSCAGCGRYNMTLK